jgi:hydroxylamine reductase
MFCYQCEQSSSGCKTGKGVCGKDETTAVLQDLLGFAAKGISTYAHRARALDARDHDVDVFVLDALFTTITNVNFDPERLMELLQKAATMRDRARDMYEKAAKAAGQTPEVLSGPALWVPAADLDGLVEQGKAVSIPVKIEREGEDINSLQELMYYGLKGAAAYADHALILGIEDEGVFAGVHEVMDVLTREGMSVEDMLGWTMRVGELNFKIMEMLDSANTGAFGHPEPTETLVSAVKGKAILISGHDLKDLEVLLEQTEGTGINVYTHGEMMPANAYPGLKKYSHLVGNYGGAWQKQGKEFDAFPGAILMTTNCIQEPRKTYLDRIFTCGLVAWPNVTHISDRNFKPVIDAALAAPGFTEDGPRKTIMTGFAHNAVLGVADTVVGAVKSGAIKHFLLIGGCDGARPGRNYFTDLAEKAPDDVVILTLGCGKYRVIDHEYGDIGGIPRLLDMGQCNDSYSAIKVALALSEAFEVEVNDLPLSLVLSWYEQKAVSVLLTLLYLGIKNIRLGPSLPQFVSPNVLNVLVEKFGLTPVGTVEEDLKEILAA